MKLEDVFASMYLVQVDIEYRKSTKRREGDPAGSLHQMVTDHKDLCQCCLQGLWCAAAVPAANCMGAAAGFRRHWVDLQSNHFRTAHSLAFSVAQHFDAC